MKYTTSLLAAAVCLIGGALASAQSNVTVRVMSANTTTGNDFSYYSPGIHIFQGLQPDVVAIQEFRYNGSPDTNGLRTLVNTAFGTNFSFYAEPGYPKPNGIISRWPIVAAGSWNDSIINDRGYAWAQIDLPGTNDLYVVSVHLYSSGSAADRNTEANEVKTQVQSNFPANAWVIVAGDFNTGSRGEPAVSTFKTFLSDSPVPVDENGNPNTNLGRNNPYDYVLPSFSLTNQQVPVVVGALNYPNGLVFDSRVYSATELANFAPVLSGDSGASGMQHMAVVKDFLIAAGESSATNPPAITTQPPGQTNAAGGTVNFSVTASGSGALAYQWRLNGSSLAGATTNPLVIANAQPADSGSYSVIITNLYGSATSSPAVLLITNAPPVITAPPQPQTVLLGQTATFSVSATGTAPLGFQWRCSGTNLPGANANPLVLAAVQSSAAGNYDVVITNLAGAVTSSVAGLTVVLTNAAPVAQWNFNSITPDASTGTGSTAPSLGNGTATLVGGTTATFAGGSTAFDPAGSTDNSGWNTTTYPAQGTGNKTRGLQFAVSTAGRQNIIITWASQSSDTGSKYGRLQYSTNGINFVDFSTPFTNGTSFTGKTNQLAGVPGVNNNSNFVFRFVSEFEGTAIANGNNNYAAANPANSYGTGGTMRFDMVTVSGATYVSATAAQLLAPVHTNGMLRFNVIGATGVSYAVERAANLAAPVWVPIFTNMSPFTFEESSASGQAYYRATSR